MRNLRYSVLAVVCVLAATVSAVGAATASATFTLTTTKCTGGAIINLCYETASKEKLELEGTQGGYAVGTKGNFIIPTVLNLEFQSSEAEATMEQPKPLTEEGKIISTNGFVFLTNSIKGEKEIAEDCKPTSAEEKEVKTAALTAKLTTVSNLEIKPKSGNTFVELTFENATGKTCPTLVKGTHAVTGFQDITVEKAETAEPTKKGKPEGKNLKFVSKAAELTGSVELKFETKAKGEVLGDEVYISKEA